MIGPLPSVVFGARLVDACVCSRDRESFHRRRACPVVFVPAIMLRDTVYPIAETLQKKDEVKRREIGRNRK